MCIFDICLHIYVNRLDFLIRSISYNTHVQYTHMYIQYMYICVHVQYVQYIHTVCVYMYVTM